MFKNLTRFFYMKKLILGLCLFGMVLNAQATVDEINAVTIHSKFGKGLTIMLDEYPMVTFSGKEMTVSTQDVVLNYDATTVAKFTYESLIVGVNDVDRPENMFRLDKTSLKVFNLDPYSKVMVYTVDGVLVSSETTDAKGNATLPLPEAENAVYVVKTSDINFKIRKQ